MSRSASPLQRRPLTRCAPNAGNRCSTDVPTRSIVDEFAASNQAFYDAFIPAWVKMQELGLASTLQVQTSLGNMAPPLFHINEIPLRVAANPAKCAPAGC